MIALNPLQAASARHFIEIIKSKKHPHQDRLKAIQKRIEAAFLQLDIASPEIPLVPIGPLLWLSKDEVDSLVHAYQGSTEPLRKLKTFIKQSAGDLRLCCYCQIDSCSTFDHILPINTWPEYSVCAINLVPVCDTCNRNKSDHVFGTGGERLFLNAHRDRISQTDQWLYAHTGTVNGKTYFDFELRPPPTMDSRLCSILRSHFDELKLLERYREKSAEVLAEYWAYNQNENPSSTAIRKNASRLRERFGTNYFKAAAFDALAAQVQH